jgi:hypothetical protein
MLRGAFVDDHTAFLHGVWFGDRNGKFKDESYEYRFIERQERPLRFIGRQKRPFRFIER